MIMTISRHSTCVSANFFPAIFVSFPDCLHFFVTLFRQMDQWDLSQADSQPEDELIDVELEEEYGFPLLYYTEDQQKEASRSEVEQVKIIEQVRKFPAIYIRKEYRATPRVKSCWEAVAKAVHLPGE